MRLPLLLLLIAASVASAAPLVSPREAPAFLSAAEAGIGRFIPDLGLLDLTGQEVRLSKYKGSKGLVLASVSTTCPVSKRYLPTLAKLAHQYAGRSVGFVLLAGEPMDAAFRATLQAACPGIHCLDDSAGELRRALGATSSTDVFLLDAARTLVYRGAIDDQYGLGYSRGAPTERYLSTAIDTFLAGKMLDIAATEAPGCALESTPPGAITQATYHGEISRLLQNHCQECHHKGGVGPFPLETFAQVEAKAGMIRKMVHRGLMPPWFAAGPAPGQHSPWINDRSLREEDRQTLFAWLDAGKPLGDPNDAPLPRTWPDDWQIGKPDLIVQVEKPIEVPATGLIPYQEVFAELNLSEPRWVRGFEIRPSSKEVVHHVLVYAEPKDAPKESPPGAGENTGYLAAYLPGNSYVLYPDGFAKYLPANSRLRFQVHYTPSGVAAQDRPSVGFVFDAEPPRHVVRVAVINDADINIPAGADGHSETAAVSPKQDWYVLGMMPHMHFRGKSYKVELVEPTGTARTLLELPRYDYNWQITYRYAQPLFMPAGTSLRATGTFDNSTGNPANPDSSIAVHWGRQMTEEMMLAYVEYYVAKPNGPR